MLKFTTMEKLWYKFLNNCIEPEGSPYSFGVSIPLIVGAYFKAGKIPGEALQSNVCIAFVLQEIIDSGKRVKICQCGRNGNTHMISLDDVDAVVASNPNINNQIYLPLYFTIDGRNTQGNLNINDVACELYRIYGNYIREHKFSCNSGIWGDFTQFEQKALELAMK